MNIYQKIYEFAASAGALEGYVYQKTRSDLDVSAVSNWVDNLRDAYHQLPAKVTDELQSCCDQTLGRAIRSLVTVMGEEHTIIGKLRIMVEGKLPASPDDFQKEKWFMGHR